MHNIKKTFVMISECVHMSIANIRGSRMRSFLTILGILIGVTAVIALITTVNGVSTSLSSSFSSMGAGTLTVQVSGSDLKEGLSVEDLKEISELDYIKGVIPSVSLTARVSRGGEYDKGISVSGKNAFFFQNSPTAVKRGRPITVVDEDNTTFVCLINQDMLDTFFYGVNPIGEYIYISGIPFLVIGITSEDADSSLTSLIMGSPDILIPYTTAMKMNNVNVVTSFTVNLKDGIDSEKGSDMLSEKLDAMFSYEDDCYEITTMSSIEDTMDSMLGLMSALLAGIASIALVVGGIGIMNMMLTTVTERTVEIGLKKALGALSWHIQVQFLMESFLLSMIGGLVGVGLGIGLSAILCNVMGTSFAISVDAIVLGVSFSAAVGIIFGWAPARKASKLNPIDALRSA